MLTAPRARPAAVRDQSAEIYRKLKDLIVSGQLTPGVRLIETELANRFGTSRTPVRAVLDRLEQEGFVVASPGLRHSLSQVAPLTREDGDDLMATLAALDGAAARAAAELPEEKRSRLVAALREANARLTQGARVRRPDAARLHELDAEFHRLIVAAAAGPRLSSMAESIRPQVTRYGRQYALFMLQRVEESIAEHAAIIGAIERGDPDVAERAAAANYRNGGKRLLEVIGRMGERGRW